jgi:hypothetical protein
MTIAGNIQSIRDDVYAGGGPTDMASYGQIFFGRNNCSLSEFIGRSWWKAVTTYGGSNIAIPGRGTVTFMLASSNSYDAEWNVITGQLFHTNDFAWNSFNYISIPGVGNIGKGSFYWDGTYWRTDLNHFQTSAPTWYYAPI